MEEPLDVGEMLEDTYSMLVDDEGQLKPQTDAQLFDVATRLRLLDAAAKSEEHIRKLGALQELFDQHVRRSRMRAIRTKTNEEK